MVLGEGRAFLSCLVVMDPQQWQTLCTEQGFDPAATNSDAAQKIILRRISAQMDEFPGYAQIRRVHASLEEWTLEDGLLTPTLKMKRNNLLARFDAEIAQMYAGHGVHRK